MTSMFSPLAPFLVRQLCLSMCSATGDPNGPKPQTLAHLPGHLPLPVWVGLGPGSEFKGSLFINSQWLSVERDFAQERFQLGLFSMPSMYSKKNIVQYGNLAKRMYSKAEKTCSWILRMRLKIWVLVCSGFHNYIPQTGWVKPQKSTPHRSGGWKSKIKVLAGLVSSVASMLACGHLLLCLQMVSLCVCVLIFSSYDDTSHIG